MRRLALYLALYRGEQEKAGMILGAVADIGSCASDNLGAYAQPIHAHACHHGRARPGSWLVLARPSANDSGAALGNLGRTRICKDEPQNSINHFTHAAIARQVGYLIAFTVGIPRNKAHTPSEKKTFN